MITALACATTFAQAPQNKLKIGVLSDFSGAYSAWGGKGSVLAAEMAVEDYKKANPKFAYQVEIVSADFQLKPDLAVAIAKKWMEEGVNAIMDIPLTAAALAVNGVVKGSAVAALMNGTASNDLVVKNCSPNMVHWTYDQYSIGNPTVQALSKGGKSWFFITVDSIGGAALESGARQLIAAAGGKVSGAVKNATGISDFSGQLVQAQASKADVIALAQGGSDTTNALKQAQEFGILAGGQKIAILWGLVTDIHGMGLPVAQGLTFTEAFYWDADDNTRAFSKRFSDRYGGKVPTSVQAGAYSVLTHYLKGVDAAKSSAAPVVIAKMKELPVSDLALGKGTLRADGRMVHDEFLVQVKTPAESKGAWDLYKILRRLPGEEVFRPMSKECPLVK